MKLGHGADVISINGRYITEPDVRFLHDLESLVKMTIQCC